ncbi:MAG: protein-disulfide reductase DsbD [Candidatus Contendobacter sp.]|jgi:thiol:disulfide interchange protein DsbD|nr:protein-disulfide reductase DsbD [Gammaproteobacteria bacterium]MCC8994891.1 protein-disulfide reductase DsbD [Candidatus Contendobacter sp.]
MKSYRQVWLWLLLALATGTATGGLFDRFGDSGKQHILDADQAFQVIVNVLDPLTLEVRWTIAPGYYLYRDKFRLSVLDAPGVSITSLEIPPGEPKDDPYFGPQQVFHQTAVIAAWLNRESFAEQEVRIKVDYQGCAEIGVCYPPLSQTVPVTLPVSSPSRESQITPALRAVPADSKPGELQTTPALRATPPYPNPRRGEGQIEPEQDRLARLLGEQQFWAIPAFFGFGLLLAFTPCVFPMIPILSSLIAGQGANLTRRRALLLSLTYVLAMAATYTIVGMLAALLGQNLQIWFQNSWVLAAFSALFVALSLSMFGLYELQLPSALQNRLVDWSNRQRGGHHIGVAVMGLLSALIVGPCVAPPLIGVLTFIAVTGDLTLGAAALFALSLGMGAPLLLIGASAGHWLPHAGHWMERVKAVFGVLLLAVALWLLDRILPAAASMALWATLLIVTATYMGVLQPVAHGAPAWRTLVKGLGLVLLIYGILLLVGVAAGGRDPWQPLRGIRLVAAAATELPESGFRPVKTVADVKQAVQAANGQPVVLDFYADWCVTCRELERETFADSSVRATLAQITALQADVTANNDDDQALLRQFGIVGPPALLFFGPDGKERSEYRIVGFVDAAQFNQQVQRLRQVRN